ncbi:unnamed protein product [Gongylonema pulchrum]|uniref:Thiolase_N domain-containing protein n=1 Tax=Gongylonema pulchrum TaxID=637853 RepID=A0A183D0I5_9BILA|nr:unnamed protein product [Gongylonema pulchrum]
MLMAMTAEKLGEQYKLSRADVDKYAYQSQTRWKAAHDAGLFKSEIVPIKMKTKKGDTTFDVDEHPRVTELRELSSLKPVFQMNGLVTAGNASVSSLRPLIHKGLLAYHILLGERRLKNEQFDNKKPRH